MPAKERETQSPQEHATTNLRGSALLCRTDDRVVSLRRGGSLGEGPVREASWDGTWAPWEDRPGANPEADGVKAAGRSLGSKLRQLVTLEQKLLKRQHYQSCDQLFHWEGCAS